MALRDSDSSRFSIFCYRFQRSLAPDYSKEIEAYISPSIKK